VCVCDTISPVLLLLPNKGAYMIDRDYMWVPRCGDCNERPGCTEDGTFYCGAVDQYRKDEDEICEYFEEGRI